MAAVGSRQAHGSARPPRGLEHGHLGRHGGDASTDDDVKLHASVVRRERTAHGQDNIQAETEVQRQ